MDAFQLLETLAERGAAASLDGAALVVKPREALTNTLRAEIRAQKAPLVAILALRAHAETRRRQIHWLCPDRELFELHRRACEATGQTLRFDGRGVSQKRLTRPGAKASEKVLVHTNTGRL